MNTRATPQPLILPGLDGSNPLGFLAALGTLLAARQAGELNACLGWRRTYTWIAALYGLNNPSRDQICASIARIMSGRRVDSSADALRETAQQDFDAAKKLAKDKLDEIKKRGLRGKERKAALQAEIDPFIEDRDQKRRIWLKALRQSVPRPELAIGKHIDCTSEEYRDHAACFIEDAALTQRDSLDFLAAFGSDASVGKSGRISATPFCFITGSGHQYFLDTIRQLLQQITVERIHTVLFEPWDYRDEKLSLRWDPFEDRRYALMDRDPTATDNKSRTIWMANLLAYMALVIFPSAPTEGGLGATAWSHPDGRSIFSWPIWEYPSGPDAIRSLLQLSVFQEPLIQRTTIRARGIAAIYQSRRIQVGNPPLHKINFSQSRGIL